MHDPLSAAALVNGRASVEVPLADRGLQYGDGLFETIRVVQGQRQFWALHIDRLRRGCKILGIPMPSPDLLDKESRRLLGSNGQQDAVLKMIVTRGGGGRGYASPDTLTPTRIFSVHPLPNYPVAWYRVGVAAMFCEMRLASQPRLAGIKHLNRLEQVLARQEWRDEFAEGIMLDHRGNVIEGVMSNVFALIEGALLTPALDHCGVAGVVRERILRLEGQLGFPVEVRRITRRELLAADAVFLTNSIIGLWQLQSLEDRYWQPHPLAARLRRLSGWSDD